MENAKHPQDLRLDFQYETTPPIHLAEKLQDTDPVSDEVRALCVAVDIAHRRPERALKEAAEWAHRPR